MNKKCQIFTPENYVEELLDSVGYTKELYGKKILENSCGDGNILVAIVRRYIADCRRMGLSRTIIKNGLERDVYGIEIDAEQYQKCLDNLNKVLESEEISSVDWKIFNEDYLKWNINLQFHYVVGNPPYVTYTELKSKEQEYLKNTFKSCKKGKFDYCYAFIEKSINSLDMTGRMAYLVPSSIFKTVFGSDLRNQIKLHVEEIRDYTQELVFENVLVKSAIMILNRNRQNEILHYVDTTKNINIDININELSDKWFFTVHAPNGNHRFGDYFKVSHVVATLLNKAYVLNEKDCKSDGEYLTCGEYRIEAEVVKETASPRSLRYKKNEKIIFPYTYKDKQLVRYSEKDFKKKFPGALNYLQQFREKLDKRKKDSSTKWFEYGRTQALNGLNQEKLLISTIITDQVQVYKLAGECIPYAGMYIVPRSNSTIYTLDKAIEILKSNEFLQYVFDVGIHISGSSLRITSKDIENYRFQEG